MNKEQRINQVIDEIINDINDDKILLFNKFERKLIIAIAKRIVELEEANEKTLELIKINANSILNIVKTTKQNEVNQNGN